MLADRIGEGRTLFLGVLLSGVTLLILIAGTSVSALFAGTALLGIGIALYGVARYTAMYDLFPDHAGTSIGFVLAAADAGQSLLPPIAGIVAASIA